MNELIYNIMKLAAELDKVATLIKEKTNEQQVLLHIEAVRPQIVKSLRQRVVWDICRYVLGGCSVICEYYDKYNCHDEHIYTMFKAAFSRVYPSIYNDILTF